MEIRKYNEDKVHPVEPMSETDFDPKREQPDKHGDKSNEYDTEALDHVSGQTSKQEEFPFLEEDTALQQELQKRIHENKFKNLRI